MFPLTTLTFTTDELAMMSASLILLRRQWAKRYLEDPSSQNAVMIRKLTDFINRLDSSVTEEQGRALLVELIKEIRT